MLGGRGRGVAGRGGEVGDSDRPGGFVVEVRGDVGAEEIEESGPARLGEGLLACEGDRDERAGLGRVGDPGGLGGREVARGHAFGADQGLDVDQVDADGAVGEGHEGPAAAV